MLEQHNDLIERLLRGSSTRQREFNQGWTFTNDGTLYFSVWDEDGTPSLHGRRDNRIPLLPCTQIATPSRPTC